MQVIELPETAEAPSTPADKATVAVKLDGKPVAVARAWKWSAFRRRRETHPAIDTASAQRPQTVEPTLPPALPDAATSTQPPAVAESTNPIAYYPKEASLSTIPINSELYNKTP